MNITIRRLEPDDASNGIIETLSRLEKFSLSRERVKTLIMNQGAESTTYVACLGDEGSELIIGVATVMYRKPLCLNGAKRAYLEEVAVSSGYENQGIEEKLFEYILNQAKNKGAVEMMYLCTSEQAHKFKNMNIENHKIVLIMHL